MADDKVITPPADDKTKTDPPAEPTLADNLTPPVDPKAPVVPPVTPPADTVTPPAKIEEFEIEVADTSPLSQADVDEVAKYAGDMGLTKEQAQAELKRREDFIARGSSAYETKMKNELAEERAKLVAMPEFKDEASRKENYGYMQNAINHFKDPELFALLKGPAGSSRALAKVLISIGKSVNPDTLHGNGANTGGGNSGVAPGSWAAIFAEKQ